jgi:NAD(P)-dependent dehydrogenase (short-subunit alcohol dehydrogenase family)
MSRLHDKVIVISGGASGIGAACARLFAAEGARVVVGDIDVSAGQAVAAELGDAGRFQPLDVTCEDQWIGVLATVTAEFGRLDGLVNGAGIAQDEDNLDAVKPEGWGRVMGVNLDGTFLGCKHAVLTMKGQRSGSIVNLASILGRVGAGDAVSYCASKGGVRLLTKSAARHCAESGYRIRCNAISPGYIDTPMVAGFFADPKVRRAFEKRHLLGRLGRAGESAAMALYLMTDEAAFVTGADFAIDGGYTAI